jgi:hypothetical protein
MADVVASEKKFSLQMKEVEVVTVLTTTAAMAMEKSTMPVIVMVLKTQRCKDAGCQTPNDRRT